MKNAVSARSSNTTKNLLYATFILIFSTALLSDGNPNNLVPYIAQVALGKLDHLNVFGDDYPTKDATGVRDYIHVVDLSKGHIRALKKITDCTGVMTYNLGTGIGYSVLEILHDENTSIVTVSALAYFDVQVQVCFRNLQWHLFRNLFTSA